MPLPLSQAAEATPASRPAAAPASWLAQHRAAKSSSLSAKPTLETSRRNRWRSGLTAVYALTRLLGILNEDAEWRIAGLLICLEGDVPLLLLRQVWEQS